VARIMVTGTTGFVGGRVARRLTARGDEVHALVRTPSPVLAELGVHHHEGGLAAADADLLRGMDVVIHAAATAGPDLDAVRDVNTYGTRQVVRAAERAGVPRVVHVSTTSVYDLDALGDVEVGEDARLVTATAPADQHPASSAPPPYALTKAEAEREVAAAAAGGLSVAILRPPAVLGAGPTSTWGTRVPARLRDGEPVPRSAATTFGYVHVEDLVDAIVAAADGDAEVTVNVVGGHTTVGEYLAEVAALLPGEVSVPEDDPDASVWRGTYATDRLPAALGVRPTRTFAEAMAEIAASWAAGDPSEDTGGS
jgi:2-alkyl-3-oxoalkanoate reductase